MIRLQHISFSWQLLNPRNSTWNSPSMTLPSLMITRICFPRDFSSSARCISNNVNRKGVHFLKEDSFVCYKWVEVSEWNGWQLGVLQIKNLCKQHIAITQADKQTTPVVGLWVKKNQIYWNSIKLLTYFLFSFIIAHVTYSSWNETIPFLPCLIWSSWKKQKTFHLQRADSLDAVASAVLMLWHRYVTTVWGCESPTSSLVLEPSTSSRMRLLLREIWGFHEKCCEPIMSSDNMLLDNLPGSQLYCLLDVFFDEVQKRERSTTSMTWL